MANVIFYSTINALSYNELLTLKFGGASATITNASVSNISGYVDGFYVSYNGSFTYDTYGLTGGTVTTMSLSYGGGLLVTVTGMNLNIVDMAYSSPSQIENLMFSGSDNILSYWSTGDTYDTGSGNDRIQLGIGNDTVDGGAGTDVFVLATNFTAASISAYGAGIRINSSQGLDTLRNVEIVEFLDETVSIQVGNDTSEVLRGDANAGALMDFIFGGGGNDQIRGGAFRDRLFGNAGEDRLFGGGGGDVLTGGTGVDRLWGESGNDRLFGSGGGDALYGGKGNDVLHGQNGGDLLNGAAGRDTLVGGQGQDTLLGHRGNDLLTGGSGKDVFLFHKNHGSDTITDFEIGRDIIQIGRGASQLSQLEFAKQGANVLVSFENVEILVKSVGLPELRDADNFEF